MRITEKLKKLLSVALAIVMVLSSVPATARAEGSDGICDCGSDDGVLHAVSCAVYAAPDDPQCSCTEKCSATNIWCDVCGFDYTACTGTDTAAVYTDECAHSFTGGVCDTCGEVAVAKIGDTYYATLVEAAAEVTEGGTIEVLTDVVIGAEETLTFAAFATLNVAEGKTVTCDGTVTIGEAEGIIFKNTLYYYIDDVTKTDFATLYVPTYFKAGAGHIITTYDEATNTIIMVMDNATVTTSDGTVPVATRNKNLHIQFSGSNTIADTTVYDGDSTDSYGINLKISGGNYDLILSGAEDAVLNITAADATNVSYGIYAKSVTVTGGTVNITSGNAPEGYSNCIYGGTVVEDGATLNLTFGKAEITSYGAAVLSNEGKVNGLILMPDDNAPSGIAYIASGKTVLIADFTAVDAEFPFTVPAGSTLTVNENVTLDLSVLAADDIDFTGTVINNGTILLPEGFNIENAPQSGTVSIGDKSYTWNGEKWICDENSHIGGTATCTSQAVCENCGASYGELAAHTPDTNGKCPVDGCGYQYAAKVGDTFYETIHKALRAAEGNSGCTLTLLDDITLTSMSSYASYVNTGTFTLDLNGKTLSSDKRTLEVMGSADLTICDSVGGGKIASTGGSAVYLSGGKLTIESGAFEGSLDGVFLSGTSTLTVKGGTFVGSRAMITGFGSNVEIDLTAIDPSGLTLKNNGSGTFAPKLPEGYGMVGSDGKLLTSLSAEQSATVHKHEYKYTDLGDGNHQQACSCGLTTGEPAAHSTTAEDDKAATCIAPAYCSVCDSEYGDVDKTNHDSSVECVNGFCENGCYEPATLNAEGFYEIFNAGQLYWFARQVNIAGNTTANGKLMADIDLENRTWYPIGLYNDIAEANGSTVQKQYAGTFDGNNHTVSNFTAIGNGSQGLFGYCNESQTQIKNLGVINATVSGWNAGAVAGYCANLANCYAVGCTITGASDTNTQAVTISSVGGNNGPTVITNCWAYNCKLIVGEGEANYVMHPVGGIRASNDSVNIVQNCYYGEIVTDAEFTSTTGATEKTEAQFASGEVAYLLGTAWGQTIGTDSYPVLGGKTVYEITVCEKTAYSNTEGDVPHKFDENGFCTATPGEIHYQPAPDSDSDGFFEIGNAGQLFWFAAQVNGGNTAINAILTKDITVNENVLNEDGTLNGDGSNFRVWTPIGNYDYPYTGTFDGGGHTVSGLYFNDRSASNVGLFGYVSSGTIKHVGVINSYFNGYNHVGGVVGFSGGIVKNCYNTSTVSGDFAGGLVGISFGTVENCYNTGTVSGDTKVEGIVGSSLGKVVNCFNLDTCELTYVGTNKTAEQFASGEVAYLLNGSTSEGTLIWGQTIGTDEYPVLGGDKVYQVKNCKDETAYSNTNENLGHNYVNGICTVCGEACEHTGGTATCTTLAVCAICGVSYGEMSTTNHDSSVECENGFCPNGCYEPAELVGSYYQITNAGQLYWFAAQVNSGYTNINGELKANIVVNENVLTADGEPNGDGSEFRIWTPIGTEDNAYVGDFCGLEHTVSGLYFNDSSAGYVGLFGYVGSGTVNHVGVIDSYFYGYNYVGGVAGNNNGTVENCYNTGTVSGYVEYVGGVAGDNSGTVTNCYNIGSVGAHGLVGGVAGNNNGTVENCYNAGTVSGGSNYVGGVVGENFDTVTGCYNTGTVSGERFVGGVAGYNWTAVTNCYNTGSVSGERWVGGVAGNNWTTVTNCYNTGTVSGTTDVGGVVGYNVNDTGTATVTNCYFDSTVYSGNAIGTNYDTATDVEGKTTEQFASGEVAYLLSQGEKGDIWGQTIGTDSYPALGGAQVYQVTNCKGETLYSNANENVGHSYGTPVYTWTEDPITLTVTVSCTACGETFTGSTTDMDVELSDDGITTTYTATVTLDGKDYTDYRKFTNDVTSVNINWGTLEFTYTEESGWDNPETAWVQVENTGNTSVSVTYTYETDRTDITGSFDDGTSTVTELAIDAANTKKIWLRLKGTPSEALSNTKIGSVKLTIE